MSRIIMSKIMPKFKPFFFALVGFFAAVGLLSFSHIGPASAQSPGVNLAQLVAQVNSLQSKLTADEQTITNQGNTITGLKSQQTADEKTLSSLKAQEQSDIQNTQSREQSDIQDVQSQEKKDIQNTQKQEQTDFTRLNGSVVKLQTLTSPLSLSSDPNVGGTNTLLTITGVNVQIVDGKGSTDSTSGLGNLIIGYNRAGNDQGSGDVRTGSHNLILGDQNNYGSFGSLVAGNDNTVSGAYASVSGGQNNTASGYAASVSGGVDNTASYYYASVTGGESNVASSFAASVSGGGSVIQNNSTGWSGGTYHSP